MQREILFYVDDSGSADPDRHPAAPSDDANWFALGGLSSTSLERLKRKSRFLRSDIRGRNVCGVSLERFSRVRSADRPHGVARLSGLRVQASDGREVHGSAANACNEVGDDRCVRQALDAHPLEVLEAARADKLQLDSVHAVLYINTVRPSVAELTGSMPDCAPPPTQQPPVLEPKARAAELPVPTRGLALVRCVGGRHAANYARSLPLAFFCRAVLATRASPAIIIAQASGSGTAATGTSPDRTAHTL